MKKSLIVAIIVITLAVAMLTPQTPVVADGKNSNLFADTARKGTLSEAGNPAVIRSRYVALNLGVLGGNDGQLRTDDDVTAAFTLNLFPDATYRAVVDRVEQVSADGFSWIGHLEDAKDSFFVITESKGYLSGTVGFARQFYEIRYGGGNTHLVSQIDHSKFPGDEVIPVEFPENGVAEPDNRIISPLSDSGATVDVMVVYTSAARIAAGGTGVIESLVDSAISQANTTYSNSLIIQRLNLVYKGEVTYTESGTLATDVDRLRGTSDGYMDTVHSLRNTYKADVVSLIVETGESGSCGTAYIMASVSTSFASSAFSVVKRSCATANYSFAHELGHNMGARHNWEEDSTDNAPFTYNHGYQNPSQGWYTIMSYSCTGCVRLPYWSNPNVSYGGYPMGVAEGQYHAADNRKTLNNTAFTVANFRPSQLPAAPDGLGVLPTSPTQTWLMWADNSDDESNFRVERSPNGTTGWVEIGTALTNSYYDSTVTCGNTYYYRVRAYRSVDNAYSGYSNVAPGSPQDCPVPAAFNKSNPTNGATAQPASLTISWGTSSGATSYDYCYDTTNDNACSNWTNNGTSTSKALSGLANSTTYYWHVRAVNIYGTTYSNGSSTAFWSFTTQAAGSPPGAFNKLSPSNGATGQSTSPTLTWGTSSGATRYDYCYDTTNDNACSNWTNNGTSTSKALSGLANSTTYYWHVRAVNSNGTTYSNGSSTAFWSFTTQAAGSPPGAFNKLSPSNGATGQSTSPVLNWGTSSGATRYDYCYDTTNDNACSNWTNNGTATSKALSGLANSTTYYWHVRAVNSNGTTYSNGSSTAFWSFTTQAAGSPPGAFNKLSPSNGATGQSTSPTLTWGTSSGATRYDYCYDTTNDNACSNWTNNGTATSKALSGLANSTTYYWHVRAVNSNGTTYSNGSSTAFWSFTTQAAGSPPGAFNKSSPSNGATGQSTNPVLNWGTSSGATSYDYCYDSTNDGACSNWTSNGNSTSKTLSGLAYSTTYYWQIRAKNSSGTTYSNGGYWSFTTQANNPGSGNYYQPFSTDVIGSGEWTASNASVTVNTSGGYLNIATDGANDAYAEKSFSYNLPVIVETRMRMNSTGGWYYAPWLTIMTNASNIGISYTSDLGWAFNGFTSITTKAPSIGNWITVKAFIRTNGGELWAKYDGEANFTKITSSTWSISKVTGIRFMQPWDSNCQMDYLRISKIVTKSYLSSGANDGWVLESAEGSNKGGTLNSSATTLYVGDDAARKQYRSILSFATATLPDNAVILSVKLKVRRQGVAGTNPFTTHKPLLFDIRKPYIGTGAALAAGDFQAAVQYSGGTFSAALFNGWYTATLKTAAYQYINKTGNTQFRLRFKLDDDNDAITDILKFYSGNYSNSAYRPQLVVEYYIP